jgi:hypothetical protein
MSERRIALLLSQIDELKFRNRELKARMHGIDKIRQLARGFLQKLQDQGLKVVVFDMDQCLVAQHSRGRLSRQVSTWTNGLLTSIALVMTTEKSFLAS